MTSTFSRMAIVPPFEAAGACCDFDQDRLLGYTPLDCDPLAEYRDYRPEGTHPDVEDMILARYGEGAVNPDELARRGVDLGTLGEHVDLGILDITEFQDLLDAGVVDVQKFNARDTRDQAANLDYQSAVAILADSVRNRKSRRRLACRSN